MVSNTPCGTLPSSMDLGALHRIDVGRYVSLTKVEQGVLPRAADLLNQRCLKKKRVAKHESWGVVPLHTRFFLDGQSVYDIYQTPAHQLRNGKGCVRQMHDFV